MTSMKTIVYVGDDALAVSPIPRRLERGCKSYRLGQAVFLSGGLIVGEGDAGKSTYVRMLAAAAERRGPVMVVPLRRRNLDFAVPKPEAGRVTTLVLDGLDEWPECVREITERFASCDQAQLHVWVTSRPGSAADCLRKCGVFQAVYTLAPFTHHDVVKLADAVGCKGKAFLATALKHGCRSFLSKPGGVVALLELYADEGLSSVGAVAMMERLARKLVAESRDGVTLGPDGAACDVDELYAAAEWIAACTVLTGQRAVWMGPERGLKPGDLPFAALKAGRPKRQELLQALNSRLFEPLATARLRVAYADMPDFLAGSWAAKHMPEDELRRMAVRRDYLPDCFVHPALVWACRLKPSLADEYISDAPRQFFRCEELVSDYGFGRFVESFRRLFLRFPATDLSYMTVYLILSDLCPFDEFADWLIDDLARKSGGVMLLVTEAILLAGCTTDYVRAARVIMEAFDRPDIRPSGARWSQAIKEVIDRRRGRYFFAVRSCCSQNCKITRCLENILFGLLERYRLDHPCAGRQTARLGELIDFDRLSPEAADTVNYLGLQSMIACGGEQNRVREWLEWGLDYFPFRSPDNPDDDEEEPWTVDELAAFASPPVLSPEAIVLLAEMRKLVTQAVAAASRDKGGRPPKAGGGLSQRVVAAMFCLACEKECVTAEMVANWEASAKKGVKRGSKPPFGTYCGETVVYSAELRQKPTPENLLKLRAIIKQAKSTWLVNDGIDNRQKTHCRSDETLFKAQDGMQAELARQRMSLSDQN